MPACDKLAEFAKIKYAIKSKYAALEDKRDFNAWILDRKEQESQQNNPEPEPPCAATAAEFDDVIQGLQTNIGGLEEFKEYHVKDLYDQFGQGEDLGDFEQSIMEAFDAAKDAGTLEMDNPLQDDKPDTVPGCEDQTDPLGAQIDELAGDLKDLEDCLGFAGDYLCSALAS